MKFSVEFVGEKRSWVVDGMRERGLQALDRARAALGLHIRDIQYYPMSGQAQVVCTLDETHARRAANVFAQFDAAEVCVPHAALNQYVYFSYREDKGVGVQSMGIDAERLVEDWINAGAPLDWEPPGSSFEEPEPEPSPDSEPDSDSGSDSNAEPEADSEYSS
jgi:hypothetical protein